MSINNANMKERVTIYEVAKAAEVSLATVSRVINKHDNVSEKTKQRVEAAIKRLGYKPSALAQSLATNRSTNVAIVLPSANYVYTSTALAGMIDVSRIYGYRSSVFSGNILSDSNQVIDDIITSRVDGAVLFDYSISEEDINKLIDYKVPTVVIGTITKNENVGVVALDYETALRQIIEDYLDKGVTNICYIRIKNDQDTIFNTFDDVIIEAFENRGLTFNSYIDITDSYSLTYDQFKKIFETGPEYQVYIAPRDSLASAVSNAAYDLGYKVPEELEIIGILGTKYSLVARPTISSIDLDLYEVGSIAMRMLTKMLQDTLRNKRFDFACRYVKRNSTK
jgi:LacI family transcriptional regulator